jgi:hypothetical protein
MGKSRGKSKTGRDVVSGVVYRLRAKKLLKKCFS